MKLFYELYIHTILIYITSMYLVCTYNTINNMVEWRPPSQPDIGGIGGLEGGSKT